MSQLAPAVNFVYSEFGTDPDLAELVEIFVEGMPQRIATLNEQLAGSQWEALSRTAHQLKGSAGSYGFGQVTPLAARLEVEARQAQAPDRIRDAAERLIDLCSRLRPGCE
jgi:HPt (histidine-containing phosphotransfer) domain-containing protein